MQFLVIGSMNMDLVVETNKYPIGGETVRGKSFHQIPGGKGANQACAIGRLGGDVSFIGACGKDEYGNILINNMKDAGVNVDNIERVDKSTGIASITIEKNGENRIIIIPGANAYLTPSVIKKNEMLIKKASIIILQLEIPLETVFEAIKFANKYNKEIILDPAPACDLPNEIYKKIDYILPNESELDILVPNKKHDSNKKVKTLLDLGVKNVILTQGEKGVTFYSENIKKHIKAKKIKVVDTTAAGDAFVGGLAKRLNSNNNLEKAIEYANFVAGLSVTKIGAQSSLPTYCEVKKFIKFYNNN